MRGGQFKPGPGVEGPPPSTGFPRLWYILRNHPGKLICGNILFILLSLPIVTAPAALCGLNALVARLMQTGHCYPAKDFMDGFRQRFWSKTLFGLPFFTVIAGAALLYITGASGLLFYAAAAAALYFSLAACCFFASAEGGEEPISHMFIISLVLCFSVRRAFRLLPTLLLAVFFLVLRVALLPVFLLIGMSLIVTLAQAGIMMEVD